MSQALFARCWEYDCKNFRNPGVSEQFISLSAMSAVSNSHSFLLVFLTRVNIENSL